MEQNDNIDITEQNIVGAIDRFATNIALAGLAIIPTFLIVILIPWRLTPMIADGRPDGRSGALLAPGVFFPLIVIISLLLLASMVPELAPAVVETTPSAVNEAEASSGNGRTTFIGGDDIRQMATAWQTGEVNQILLVLLPVFAVCVVSFAATAWIRVLVGNWWTVRTAIRSGFYIFGAFIGLACVFALTVSRLDLSDQLNALLSTITTFAILALFVWCYSGVFKAGGVKSIWRVIGTSVLATASMLVASILMILLV